MALKRYQRKPSNLTWTRRCTAVLLRHLDTGSMTLVFFCISDVQDRDNREGAGNSRFVFFKLVSFRDVEASPDSAFGAPLAPHRYLQGKNTGYTTEVFHHQLGSLESPAVLCNVAAGNRIGSRAF